MSDIRLAKASCVDEYIGPGVEVVNCGSTRVSVVSAANTESAELLPSARKVTMRCRILPASRQSPTTPLQIIITVAKTVSRARLRVSSPPESIMETISASSITVTASANTKVPSGSPTR